MKKTFSRYRNHPPGSPHASAIDEIPEGALLFSVLLLFGMLAGIVAIMWFLIRF